ncbi:MAG: HEAT repeat domain-containing protein [Thermoguttaceae bacterium]|jgi:HEAT repeat protein
MFKSKYLAACAVFISALAAAVVSAKGPAGAKAPAPGASADNQSKLIAILQSDAPPQNKAITCKQLAVCGDKDAVPALAALLSDQQLASWARIALEAIPDPAAGNALREATGKLKGKLLVGAINSLGVRRDAKAVDALIPRLKDADAEVAAAAAVALGRIGGESATKTLEQSLAAAPAAVRPAVAEGCILCAERHLAAANRNESLKLYELVRKADVPKQKVLEATRGAILAQGAAGVPLLIEQLRSTDKAFFALGLRVARELPGREATAALEAELAKAAPDRQALLVLALADRSDATASPAVLVAAKEGAANVRIAAIRVLGRQGGTACVPMLLDAATETDGEVSQAAISALADLPGKELDADVAARLPKAEGKVRQLLIQLAGQRRIAAAVPTLLKAAEDPDSQARRAALQALGETIGPSELPFLISRVVKSEDAEDAKVAGTALTRACVRMPDREACAEKLIAAMSQATVPAKCSFLGTLGAMGGAKALGAVAAAAKDASPELQDAATRVLGEWMSTDAVPVLLDLAKTAADPKFKIRALRGYIRIARQLDVPNDQRLAMCKEALRLASRDEERTLVVEVLKRIRSPEAEALIREATTPKRE